MTALFQKIFPEKVITIVIIQKSQRSRTKNYVINRKTIGNLTDCNRY